MSMTSTTHSICRSAVLCLVMLSVAAPSADATRAADDGASRELTVQNSVSASISAVDAISREVTIQNDIFVGSRVNDAVSREVTVQNQATVRVLPVDAISREISIFNDHSRIDPDFDGVVSEDNDGAYDPCGTGMTVDCDDNCPFIANADQSDLDSDGLGDVCDGVPLSIAYVTPAWAGNAGNATITVFGSGFVPGATVRMSRASQPDLWAATVVIGDGRDRLVATFDLTGAATGPWDVTVTNPDGQEVTKPAALEVTSGSRGPSLSVEIRGLYSYSRPLREYALELVYQNLGDNDIEAPLLVLQASGGTLFRLNPLDAYSDRPVQLLALGPAGAVDRLPPRSKFTVPVYFRTANLPAHTRINFQALIMPADDALLDWTAMEGEVRPADIADDGWDAVWSNVRAQVGSTRGQYRDALFADAAYLASHGSRINTVRDLFAFEMMRARGGVTPKSTFDDAIDIAIGAPGLPIVFSRSLPARIDERFRLGPLGRGWRHNYEVSLAQTSAAEVEVKEPDQTRRRFVKHTGSWAASVGDTGVLTDRAGGGFQLREKDGRVSVFSAEGTLAFMEDTNGNRLTFMYTGGRLYRVEHANGRALTLTYDGNGRITTVTDDAGRTVTYVYDGTGEHLVEARLPATVPTTYDYRYASGTPSDHALTAISFPSGAHTYFSYDDRGRLSAEWAGGGERLDFQYGEPGGVTIHDAAGGVTVSHVGLDGALLDFTNPDGHTTSSRYGPDTAVSRTIDASGHIQRYAYDSRLNLREAVNQLGQTVQMGYTDLSRLAWIKDERGNVTTYTTDTKGNLQRITYPNGSHREYSVNSGGQIQAWTNRRGETIQLAYDITGRLVEKAWPDGRRFAYSYDPHGNLESATDTMTGTILLAYDVADRIVRVEYPNGIWFAYEYNGAGRLVQRVGHDGAALRWSYDTSGRMTGVVDETGAIIVAYTYSSAGDLVREDHQNGTYTLYAYDLSGRVVSIRHLSASGVVQASFEYTYDERGERTSMRTLEGLTVYRSDMTGQLIGFTEPNGRDVSYGYDAAGNRTIVIEGNVTDTFTTNAMNQYLSAGATMFTYDDDGNMTTRADVNGTTLYMYDAENRLVRIVSPLDGTIDYEYDALGQRFAITIGGSRTTRAFDLASDSIAAEYYDDGRLQRRYRSGMGLVAVDDTSGRYTFGFDALGTTSHLSDQSGAKVNSYTWEPFGRALSSTEAVPTAYRFVGRDGARKDASLTEMRNRFYDEELGRFISEDPIGAAGGVNLYSYVHNRPVMWTDPTGLGVTVGSVCPPKPECDISVERQCQRSHTKCQVASLFWCSGVGYAAGLVTAPAGGAGGILGGLICEASFIVICDELQYRCMQDGNRYCSPQASPGGGGDCGGSDGEAGGVCVSGGSCPSGSSGSTEIVVPGDPNEKLGPEGLDAARFVATSQVMPYVVYFENVPSATAPAQEIVVVDQLDSDLDWTSLSLGEVAYGRTFVDDLRGLQSGSVRVPLRDTAYVVDITVRYDPAVGRIEWRLKTIDPVTEDVPTDPLAGLLPPNDASGRGEGHVTFWVQPRTGRSTGTTIDNSATIVFDTQAPITTNTWINTLDPTPPSSSVTSVAICPTCRGNERLVSWAGIDDAGGVGLQDYSVFVSVDGGPYAPWLAQTALTAAKYVIECGREYRFYAVSRDRLLNLEPDPATPDQVYRENADIDADAICDSGDNCRSTSNVSQADTDGDGTGNACDELVMLVVSNDPGDHPDHGTIQAAIDGASESGTVIEIHSGTGTAYNESVIIDEGKTFTIVGKPDAGETVRINGGAGPAIDVRSASGAAVTTIRGLTVSGSTGVRAATPTRIEDLILEDIPGVGFDLRAGHHMVRGVETRGALGTGVDLAAGASLDLTDARVARASGRGLHVRGSAITETLLIADGSGIGATVETGGSLVIRHATVVGQSGVGVENLGGTVSMWDSIVWGNAGGDIAGMTCASMTRTDSGMTACAGQDGNLSSDPLFDAERHLRAGSPCLEAGLLPEQYTGTPPRDLDGRRRLSDFDGDGGARMDLGAFEEQNTTLTPQDIANLRAVTKTRFLWDSTSGASAYHAYRGHLTGSVDRLSYGFFGRCIDGSDPVLTDTVLDDVSSPAVGDGLFYLITAENAAGHEGTLGYGTQAERSNYQPCP